MIFVCGQAVQSWPADQPWYNPKDPYPRRRACSYSVARDGMVTLTREAFQIAALSREEAQTYEALLDAWWRRMAERGARLPWLTR